MKPFGFVTCCVCEAYDWSPTAYSTDEESKFVTLGCITATELYDVRYNGESMLALAAQESRLFCYFEEDDVNLANFFPNDDPCL